MQASGILGEGRGRPWFWLVEAALEDSRVRDSNVKYCAGGFSQRDGGWPHRAQSLRAAWYGSSDVDSGIR